MKWHGVVVSMKLGNTKLQSQFLFVMQLHCAGMILIRNRKLLLAFSNNKQCFYLPGGKVDLKESAVEALCREVREELSISVTEKDLTYYTHITAPAFGEEAGIMMEQDCFLLTKEMEPIASAEIGELRFFTLSDYTKQEQIAPGVVQILQQLKADGLLD